LATNDHFSSNWTSRVSGGKGHQLVVGGFGVLAGQEGQSRDRVLVDPHQTSRLPDAAAVGQVLQDGQHFLVWQPGIEERRPLELGEPGLADFAVEQPVASFPEVVDDEKITLPPATVEFTVGILAAEAGKFVRGHGATWTDP
jgi:hypothetical protein